VISRLGNQKYKKQLAGSLGLLKLLPPSRRRSIRMPLFQF